MTKFTHAIALIGICAVGLSVAYSKEEPARPDGVAASSWIALGTDAGFVITGNADRNNLGVLTPSLSGYFVARRDGNWIKLEPELTERFSHAS
jgi:hypothetical protein